MKLTDLTNIDPNFVYLQLDETLNTTALTTWSTDEKGDKVGLLTVDDKKFRIRLEKGQIELSDTNVTFLHVSFQVWSNENNEWTDDPTYNNKSAMKVLGAIVNAINEALNHTVYDAIVFGASNQIEKRMRIYNWVVSRFSKQFGGCLDNFKTKSGNVYSVVCSKSFSREFTTPEMIEKIDQIINK
jgi:hypothetical protein